MKKEEKVKSLLEIKDEVAKEANFHNWDNLTFVWANSYPQLKKYCDEVSERYANQQLKQYQDKLIEIRDDLYNAVPKGQLDAFQLIRVISTHTDKLDELISTLSNLTKKK